MKWFKQGMLAFGVLCGVMLLNPQAAQAKTLKESKSYKIDLDGNGTKERVKCVGKETGEYNGYAVSIYVNGKKALSLSDDNAISAEISLLDINKNDSSQELYIHFQSESAGFEKGCGYRYKGGALKKLFTFSGKDAGTGRLSVMEKQPGDGKVYFSSEFYDFWLQQGYVKTSYKISSGKLKAEKKSVLNTTGSWRKQKYRATMSLKAYDSTGAKSEKFTVKKGDIFYVYKLKFKTPGKLSAGITYLYVRTADGKEGWIKNPQKRFYEGYNEGNGDWEGGWSDYAYVWGKSVAAPLQ